jgi:menaquinone-dependent protoporphyrinogen oxidase
MKVLVAYASKYGATEGIAERIAAKLTEQGLSVDARRVDTVADAGRYDAFVVGSAVYIGSWLKDAVQFVERNQPVLSTRPLWIFSSGPIGAATTDAQGRDVRTSAVRKEVAGLKESLAPRDHHVFFGAFDRSKLRIGDRLIAAMPAFPGSEGDFRDWNEIDAWSTAIAQELSNAPRPMAAIGVRVTRHVPDSGNGPTGHSSDASAVMLERERR